MNMAHLTEDENSSWWEHSQEEEEEQKFLLDREQMTTFEKECEVTISIFLRMWEEEDYRRINSWLLGAGSFCKAEGFEDIYFLQQISFIKENL
jgi:hypothetical protein